MTKLNTSHRKIAFRKALFFTLITLVLAMLMGYLIKQSTTVDQQLVLDLQQEVDRLRIEKMELVDHMETLFEVWTAFNQIQEKYYSAVDHKDPTQFSLEQSLTAKADSFNNALLELQVDYYTRDSLDRTIAGLITGNYRALLATGKMHRQLKEQHAQLENSVMDQNECLTNLQAAQQELNQLYLQLATAKSGAHLNTLIKKENEELKVALKEEQRKYEKLSSSLNKEDNELRLDLMNLENELTSYRKKFQEVQQGFLKTLTEAKDKITFLQRHRNLDCMKCCAEKMGPIEVFLDRQILKVSNLIFATTSGDK